MLWRRLLAPEHPQRERTKVERFDEVKALELDERGEEDVLKVDGAMSRDSCLIGEVNRGER